MPKIRLHGGISDVNEESNALTEPVVQADADVHPDVLVEAKDAASNRRQRKSEKE